RVPLLSPPASSLPDGPDPESDSLHAPSPTVTRFLATVVTDPSFESTAASALVAELVDFAATCCLDYAASLVAESESASVCPPSVRGECTLGTDVLEERNEEFEFFAAALPHLVSMLLAPEGDPDAPDIPTPRSYAEAIEGTYVDEVPPPGANIVSGMWIFRVKRPPGSPHVFKARYVARGFSQRQGRDYELHSLDFSTAFLQGSLHEEIWLRRPPGFTGSFLAGTQWSLRRPVYGLRQAPCTYVDEVPPPGANIVSGMWIFRVKRPPGSPHVFKARYVARGFSQRQGRDYELHSLDFSTAFLQGSLHEEIWLRRPPGFTGSFLAGTQWSLRRPVYGLRQAP
ncbi:unnamed protein product, partial [Closterium sp. NIES-53]